MGDTPQDRSADGVPEPITPEPLAVITDRYDLSEATCPACGEIVKVAWPDGLRPHSTPLGWPCIGERHSRCESLYGGLRCQLAPHESGRHVRRTTRHSGLSAWDDAEVKPVTPAEQRTGVSDVQASIADEVAALRVEIHAVTSGLVLGVLPTERDMLARLDRIAALVPQRAKATGFDLPLWLHVTCGGTATGRTAPKLTICRKCDALTGEADWRALYTAPGR